MKPLYLVKFSDGMGDRARRTEIEGRRAHNERIRSGRKRERDRKKRKREKERKREIYIYIYIYTRESEKEREINEQ